MSKLMVVALSLLLLVPASSALDLEYAYGGEGVVAAVLPLEDGDVAVVAFREEPGRAVLRLVYVHDGQAEAWEQVLPEPILPDRVMVEAAAEFVHVVMNWTNEGTGRIHHYRWRLPDGVEVEQYRGYDVFAPVVSVVR